MVDPVKKTNVLKVTVVVLSYWTISILMVFFNKYLLGERKDDDISLFVSWIQCIITVLAACLINCYTRSFSISLKHLRELNLTPVFKMAFFFVGMLSFNNMCLKIVGVAFYQIARSTTIIFVVIFSIIILKKHVSLPIFGCCLLVMAGFVLGVDQENALGSFSWKGVIFGVSSSVFIAFTGIYTKQALVVVEKNELKLTTLTNIIASIFFIPVIFFTGEFSTALASPRLLQAEFWSGMLATGFLGLAISWISTVQINITSPVSNSISSNCKAVLQTIMAVLYFREAKGLLWWISVALVILGAVLYTLRKFHEEKASNHPEQFSNKASSKPFEPLKPPVHSSNTIV